MRHYMNASISTLVVRMSDGSRIVREHSFGFDAFAALERINASSSRI